MFRNIVCFFFFFSEVFKVEVNADATNLAYRSTYLQLHTDLPYYEYTPGVTCNLIYFCIPTADTYEQLFIDNKSKYGFRLNTCNIIHICE